MGQAIAWQPRASLRGASVLRQTPGSPERPTKYRCPRGQLWAQHVMCVGSSGARELNTTTSYIYSTFYFAKYFPTLSFFSEEQHRTTWYNSVLLSLSRSVSSLWLAPSDSPLQASLPLGGSAIPWGSTSWGIVGWCATGFFGKVLCLEENEGSCHQVPSSD